MSIPFAKPYTDEREVEAIAEVIRSGWITQGSKVREFEERVAGYVGAKYAVAVNSCTSALHLTLLLQGVGPGDEVICPSFTCVATPNAIRHVGARPVFAEIDPLTFNLDPEMIAVSTKTKAIMAVHQVGLVADMDPIQEVARQHSLLVVEDAACALGAIYKNKRVGSLGSPSCFSFHPRKVITTGEGGMIATDDEELAERARVFRAHGASISDLVRHEACGTIYASYPEIGYNYRMTDMQAAMGIEQMKKLPLLLERRRMVANFYDAALAEVDEVEVPHIPDYGIHSYQSYLIRLWPDVDRDKLLRSMSERGVSCRHGIAPSHLEPCYRELYGHPTFPVTEEVSRTTMFLPMYPGMTGDEARYVVDNLKELLANGS